MVVTMILTFTFWLNYLVMTSDNHGWAGNAGHDSDSHNINSDTNSLSMHTQTRQQGWEGGGKGVGSGVGWGGDGGRGGRRAGAGMGGGGTPICYPPAPLMWTDRQSKDITFPHSCLGGKKPSSIANSKYPLDQLKLQKQVYFRLKKQVWS